MPVEVLNGYKGFIQTDGYDGYQELGSSAWDRARWLLGSREEEVLRGKGGLQEQRKRCAALSSIDSLFRIERTLRAEDFTPDRSCSAAASRWNRCLRSCSLWLQERKGQVPPSMMLGKAIGYTLGQWPKLVRYLDSPLLGPDNNACERAIRPFVVGRKNWLLSGSPAGAEASAAWYSLIETAKLNGVEPYLYLCYILSRLPDSDDPAEYRFLLPWSISKESLLDFESGRLAKAGRSMSGRPARLGCGCFDGYVSSCSWTNPTIPPEPYLQQSGIE